VANTQEEVNMMIDEGRGTSVNLIEICDDEAILSVELKLYRVNNVIPKFNLDNGFTIRLALEAYMTDCDIEAGGIELVRFRR